MKRKYLFSFIFKWLYLIYIFSDVKNTAHNIVLIGPETGEIKGRFGVAPILFQWHHLIWVTLNSEPQFCCSLMLESWERTPMFKNYFLAHIDLKPVCCSLLIKLSMLALKSLTSEYFAKVNGSWPFGGVRTLLGSIENYGHSLQKTKIDVSDLHVSDLVRILSTTAVKEVPPPAPQKSELEWQLCPVEFLRPGVLSCACVRPTMSCSHPKSLEWLATSSAFQPAGGWKGQGWEIHSHFKGFTHPFGQNLVLGLSRLLGRLEIESLAEWPCGLLRILLLGVKGRQLWGQLMVSATPLGVPVPSYEINQCLLSDCCWVARGVPGKDRAIGKNRCLKLLVK